VNINTRYLNGDALYRDNMDIAIEYMPVLRTYYTNHPGASMYDAYTDLHILDIPMYLAIFVMVRRGELEGPLPYDDDRTTQSMSDMHYSVPGEQRAWAWKYALAEARGWLPMVGVELAHSLGRCQECGDVTWLDAMGYCTHCIPF
jgi:hypothetical protein